MLHMLDVKREEGRYSIDDARERFARFGICVLKRYFEPQTRDELRTIVEERLERARQRSAVLRFDQYPDADFLLGDVLAVRELEPYGNIFFRPECIDLVKGLLRTDELLYWGDSSIQIGAAARGFHKDNVDRDDGRLDDWTRDYEIVRCGFYFQDHLRHSGGLKVRLESHTVPDHLAGRIADVATEYGDLVIWNMRLTHSGNACKLRLLPGTPLHPRVEARIPQFLVVPEQIRRMAAFCAFGKPGSHVDRYIDRMNARAAEYRPYFQFARRVYSSRPL